MFWIALTSGRQQVLFAGHSVVDGSGSNSGGGWHAVAHLELNRGERGRRQLVPVGLVVGGRAEVRDVIHAGGYTVRRVRHVDGRSSVFADDRT